MDFGRFLTDLVVFVGITVVLMCSFHLLVLWHSKRKYAKLSRPEKQPQPSRAAQPSAERLISVPDRV